MDAIPKIVVMFCGLLLCLGLSGNAASAAHDMKAGPTGERIGGQAGWEYDRGHDQNKQESIAAQAGERIGGQAGREYDRGHDQNKQESVAAQAGERIGGQAGLGYEQANRQRMAAQ